jgi:hypothetical protein
VGLARLIIGDVELDLLFWAQANGFGARAAPI